MGNFLKHKKSKALVLGVITPLVMLVGTKFGITEELATKISEGVMTLVAIFIGGQSIADGLSGGKTATK